jgi:ABC-type dipeptide/oligopeptide/nickel transport system permease subunit
MEGGQAEYLLGTDMLGRDYLTRLIWGARVSLMVASLAVAVSTTLGVLLGLLAGYFGHTVDWVISSGLNIMMAFPFVLLALAVIAVIGPSLPNMIAVLGISGWPIYTRVVRAEVQRLKVREFVLAAQTVGAGDLRIILKHILPNVLNAIIVIASLEVARMIIAEAFLSFLGLGVQPPTPSWGGMLGEGKELMFDRWWLATFPGLAIFIATLAINLFGDGLRDWFDPYSKVY